MFVNSWRQHEITMCYCYRQGPKRRWTNFSIIWTCSARLQVLPPGCNRIMPIWFNWSCCSVAAAVIFSLASVANASSSSSHADWLARRQATDSGLCRIYSYNVERQSTALSLEIGQFGNVQQTFAVPERRYFVCCQDDGTETACRDKTYQRPHTGTQRPEG